MTPASDLEGWVRPCAIYVVTIDAMYPLQYLDDNLELGIQFYKTKARATFLSRSSVSHHTYLFELDAPKLCDAGEIDSWVFPHVFGGVHVLV